nr:MAG TPA: hypothetical protein [Caudoviricetes sp.]
MAEVTTYHPNGCTQVRFLSRWTRERASSKPSFISWL